MSKHTGETLDLSGASNGAGKFGFTLRVPCGVVAAITPFNFPLNHGVPQGRSRIGSRQLYRGQTQRTRRFPLSNSCRNTAQAGLPPKRFNA